MRTIKKDKLKIKIFESRDELGKVAAHEVALAIKDLLATKETISIIFASAPSQNEFLAYLSKEEIEWDRIIAFNMDEYVGISKDAPQGFGAFLKRSLYDHVSLKEIHLFNTLAENIEEECVRYGQLLDCYKPDICIYGVGENGHLAFNDPPVCDFNDPKVVKIVELDPICRNQQVNDGCFSTIEEVPQYAFTITIPTVTRVPKLFGMVPGKTKMEAIDKAINGEISTACPASILRTHDDATLYLDEVSASKIKQ